MRGEVVAIGAFLDEIVDPLTEMPRIGRPSIAEEAIDALDRPEYEWIKKELAYYFCPISEREKEEAWMYRDLTK